MDEPEAAPVMLGGHEAEVTAVDWYILHPCQCKCVVDSRFLSLQLHTFAGAPRMLGKSLLLLMITRYVLKYAPELRVRSFVGEGFIFILSCWQI